MEGGSMIKHKAEDNLVAYFIGYNPHDPTLALLKQTVDRIPGMDKIDALEMLLSEAGNNAIVTIPDNLTIVIYKR
jgi:hypothetical protein